MRPTIAIVDPFSSGALYPAAFQAAGWDSVAVISRPTLPPRMLRGLCPQEYRAVLPFSAGIATELRDLGVQGVVAGCETAIHCADSLARELGCAGNPPSSSDMRRHKNAMQAALARAGLAHIWTRTVAFPADIESTVAGLKADAAYVVKPINSAGTDGVRIAVGAEAVRNTLLAAAWGTANYFGEQNRGFVVQPFVQGHEYVLDMVACGGEVAITSTMRYQKIARNGGAFVYRRLDALDPRDPAMAPLCTYARRAAAALEIHVGAIHMEVLWPDEGPVMVEAGSRLVGGKGPSFLRHCYTPHLLEQAVSVHTRGALVGDRQSARTQFGRMLFLINDRERPFHPPEEGELGSLPSYCGHHYYPAPGTVWPVTIDFATCPGSVWLSHSSEAQVDRDEERCRELLAGYWE